MCYMNSSKQIDRIINMIKHLYCNEKMHTHVYASKYGVSTRTITRYFNKINKQIPLSRNRGVWWLDIERINNNLSNSILKALVLGNNADMKFLSFAISYDSVPLSIVELILSSIDKKVKCNFKYTKNNTVSTNRVIDPIKLFAQKGRLYLVARDYKDDIIKTFLLNKINAYVLLKDKVTLSRNMIVEANNIGDVWHGAGELITVSLYVKPEVSNYIKEQKLHHSQEIVDYHYDGGIEVECKITHRLELLPGIKSWIPYIYILEPKWLHDEFVRELELYKSEDWEMDI